MKKTTLILIVSSVITIIIGVSACHTSKKSTTSTATSAPASTNTTTSVVPPNTETPVANPIPLPPITKSPDGIYPPGNEELVAIQVQYKDVTLEKLKEGHILYTQSACIGCHAPQNIYVFDEMRWGFIMNDMAMRAKLTQSQKDAVYKYVLAIKAAKPK